MRFSSVLLPGQSQQVSRRPSPSANARRSCTSAGSATGSRSRGSTARCDGDAVSTAGANEVLPAEIIAGLDPAIHPLRKTVAKRMDTRVKPAYDAVFVLMPKRAQ